MTTHHQHPRHRLRPETVMAISDVIRDVAVVKRDLQQEISAAVPMGAVAVLSVIDREGPMRVGELAEHLVRRPLGRQSAREHPRAARAARACAVAARPSLPRRRRSPRPAARPRRGPRTRRWRGLADALSGWTDDELRQLAATLTRLRNDLSPSHSTPHSENGLLVSSDHRSPARPLWPRPPLTVLGQMSHREVLEAMSGLLLGMLVAILSSTVVSTSLPKIIGDLARQPVVLHLGRHLDPAGDDRQHAGLGQVRRPLQPQAAAPAVAGHLRARLRAGRTVAELRSS